MMAVTGLNRPDFRTISDFRKRHLVALSDLFVQVLRLCQMAGLVKLGHVAVDGTKLRANAGKHEAMSYLHMVPQEVIPLVVGRPGRLRTTVSDARYHVSPEQGAHAAPSSPAPNARFIVRTLTPDHVQNDRLGLEGCRAVSIQSAINSKEGPVPGLHDRHSRKSHEWDRTLSCERLQGMCQVDTVLPFDTPTIPVALLSV